MYSEKMEQKENSIIQGKSINTEQANILNTNNQNTSTLQMKSTITQLMDSFSNEYYEPDQPNESIQRMIDVTKNIVEPKKELLQRKENNTGMPDNLKAGVENLSGLSMDDVNVHYNSDKPSEVDALAYTQGTDIHVGPGQEKHLPHEVWHVVQQKEGRVKPTIQMAGNININDDSGLEKEADVMGNKAMNSTSDNIQIYEQVEKPKENKSRVVANSVAQKKSCTKQGFGFVDNRPAGTQMAFYGMSSQARFETSKTVSPVVQAMSFVLQRAHIDLTSATQIKPGSPPTLKDQSYFYKVFNKKSHAQAMETQWDTAEQNGILTPAHGVVSVTHNGTHKWAFRSKEASGKFFQFSKGHTGLVKAWIQKQTNKIYLGRLRNIFDYVNNNIGDGQGFFEDSDGGKVLFIDINNSGRTPNAAQIVTDIEVHLKTLP